MAGIFRGRMVWIMLLLAVVIAVSGCGDQNNAVLSTADDKKEQPVSDVKNDEKNDMRVVTDHFGEVSIPVHPKRVSGLYREDYLVMLGVTPIVQYYNPMFGKQDYLQLDVPLFDVSGSIEALLAAAPDLIIAAGEVDAAKYEAYSKVAPTFRLPDSILSDSRKTLTVIADLLGIPEKAEQVLKDYEERIADVKAKVQSAAGNDKLVVLRMNVTDKSLNIFGINNSFVGQILYQDLGFSAPVFVKNMTESNIVLSNEAIPELDADRIIILPSNGTWEDEGNDKALKELFESPLWKSVPAVMKGQVYPVERSYWQTGAIMANHKKMDELLKLIVP
ncbi:ABC transporter substrate-binding protein [Paenibacillus eucommiae]|uniref:Iron complex transport system substrate-binding protein n=1 Tax=Paenibacillus eucommiae TaxID=1355755 RepID=A0ABS4J5M3_9BACL|nr:ABC transporter substrate-binding protein [Paenibacillus eucommiae]MBP1995142.1 iron complex transport system substrate-binding protein [Paenibacillus eucommiae]